jgi:hypothetical protein
MALAKNYGSGLLAREKAFAEYHVNITQKMLTEPLASSHFKGRLFPSHGRGHKFESCIAHTLKPASRAGFTLSVIPWKIR